MVARPWLWVRASAWSEPVVVQVVAADAGPAVNASTASVVAAAAMTVRSRGMGGTLPQHIDQLNNVNAASRRTLGCRHPDSPRYSRRGAEAEPADSLSWCMRNWSRW